jgi:hypothetical protein
MLGSGTAAARVPTGVISVVSPQAFFDNVAAEGYHYFELGCSGISSSTSCQLPVAQSST